MSSWDNIDTGSGSSNFFKLVEGPNRCRIVGAPLRVWKSFEGVKPMYLTENAAKADSTAQVRVSVYVIDRADGKIKVAEFGASVVAQLKALLQNPDYSFEGTDIYPYDVTINREGTGKDNTRYTVIPSPKLVPLTLEETNEVAGLTPLGKVLAEKAVDGQAYLNEPPF